MRDPLYKDIHKQYHVWLIGLVNGLGRERLQLFLARVLYRLKVYGDGSIPAKGGCLVAFNHVSDISDMMVYLVIHSHRPDVSLFAWGLSKETISGLLGAVGMSGSGERLLTTDMRPAQNVKELLRARQVLLDGGCVAIAPEGETTWDGRLQSPLAPGAAWLALHTAIPIIPVISKGGYDVQPLWRRERFRLTGRIRIHVGLSLALCEQPLKNVNNAQVQAATQRLWQALTDMLVD